MPHFRESLVKWSYWVVFPALAPPSGKVEFTDENPRALSVTTCGFKAAEVSRMRSFRAGFWEKNKTYHGPAGSLTSRAWYTNTGTQFPRPRQRHPRRSVPREPADATAAGWRWGPWRSVPQTPLMPPQQGGDGAPGHPVPQTPLMPPQQGGDGAPGRSVPQDPTNAAPAGWGWAPGQVVLV